LFLAWLFCNLQTTIFYLRKNLKRLLKIIGGVLAFFVLFVLVLYAYVYINKKSILLKINDRISHAVEGSVTMDDIDLTFFSTFPNVGFRVKNLVVKDSLYAKHHHPFFQAKNLSVTLSSIQLITTRVRIGRLFIEDGSMYVYTDSLGYANNYLLRLNGGSKNGKRSPGSTVNNIELRQFDITIDDEKKQKYFALHTNRLKLSLSSQNGITRYDVSRSNIRINNFVFNPDKGSYLKGKTLEGSFVFSFDKNKQLLSFNNIAMNISGQLFRLTGEFNLTKEPGFHLHILSNRLSYAFAKTLLTPAISDAISIAGIDRPFNVVADISGPLHDGTGPLVNVNAVITDNTVHVPHVNLSNASFTVNYTNEVTPGLPRKDPNSKIEIHDLQGSWEGIPIQSKKMVIQDLSQPVLKCDLRSHFNLATLNNILSSNTLDMQEGEGDLNVAYTVPLQKSTSIFPTINGTLGFSNGLILYGEHKTPLKNCSAEIVFSNADMQVNKVKFTMLRNTIEMTGTAKNFVRLFSETPDKIQLNWEVYSPILNLQDLVILLSPRGGKNSNGVKTKKPNQLTRTAEELDNVLENGNIHLSLKAGTASYQHFEAQNLSAVFDIVANKWTLEQAGMQYAGGQLSISGTVEPQPNNNSNARIKMNLQNMDARKVLYGFNDFGQEAISYRNLEGKLNSTIDLGMTLDNDGHISPPSIQGTVFFSLKEGHLLNYWPVKKIQNFIFKKRNFDDIQFAEIKDTLTIRDQKINIRRMEIQSSVLSLYLEGVYGLQKNTDLSLQIPLSNLKKRDSSYVPENKGADTKGGMSIFLRAKNDKDGSIKITYDLFKKLKKSKVNT